MNQLALFFQPVPAETVVAYASWFRDYDEDVMTVVVHELVSTAKRFPTVAQVQECYAVFKRDVYEPPVLVPMRPENIVDPSARAKIQELFDGYWLRHPMGQRFRRRARV